MASSNLHLVDNEGRPLAKHIVEAVERLEPKITKRFSRYCDPAVLSNSMEDSARRIAEREQEKGRLPDADIGRFTWRTLFNAAISLIRAQRGEKWLSTKALWNLTGAGREGSPEAIVARIEGQKILSEMSERDERICDLESQGFDDSEIAAYLNVSKNALAQARCRRKAKLAALDAKRSLRT